jgi:Domain of unknown function (DUF4129)
VSRRRLVTVAVAITALLAVVAVVARGRPLGSSSATGSGLPLTFWDYVFTTFLIFVVLLMLLGLVAFFLLRRERMAMGNYKRSTARSLAFLLAIAALIAYVGHRVDLQHLFHPNGSATTTLTNPAAGGKNANHHGSPAARHVRFRWDELAIVLGVLIALGAAAYATRSRLLPAVRRGAPEELAAALDESIEDLRTEPDLRRAIVAAYARMETALAAAGIPRHHAEAPLEYMERALLTLDTSASAVRRLTDLFALARFSQHEPDPSMRDEAINALVAVRDELRASELVPA